MGETESPISTTGGGQSIVPAVCGVMYNLYHAFYSPSPPSTSITTSPWFLSSSSTVMSTNKIKLSPVDFVVSAVWVSRSFLPYLWFFRSRRERITDDYPSFTAYGQSKIFFFAYPTVVSQCDDSTSSTADPEVSCGPTIREQHPSS